MTISLNIPKPRQPQDRVECLTVTVAETAEMLGVCEKTIYNLVQAGTLQKVPIGRRTLFSKKAVLALVDGAVGVEAPPASH